MNPYNLLIIEDDKLTSESLQKWFGYQVNSSGEYRWNIDTAFDGREALYKIKNNKYDAVILDLQLPEINGKELLYQCKEELINVCTTIFSSHKEILSLEEACELNVFSYFLKGDYQPVQIELSLIRGIELKQIEQTHSKNTALLNLSREVCHDIKNYLHPIIGFAEMFEMSAFCEDQHQCKDIMKHIQSSANAIKNLSNELYLFSGCLLNQENKKAQLSYNELECLSSCDDNKSPLSANGILNTFKNIIQEYSKLYEDRITFIDNLYLNGEVRINGSAFQLERIFRNILKNVAEAVTESCNQGLVKI